MFEGTACEFSPLELAALYARMQHVSGGHAPILLLPQGQHPRVEKGRALVQPFSMLGHGPPAQ